MIRVVIDTNIALAGFLSYTRNERKIINCAMQRKISLIGSIDTFNEFSRKLDENAKFKQNAKDFMFSKSKLLASYKAIIRFTEVDEELKKKNFCTADPDDDAFIKAAIASNTKIIVSRDKHLLRLNNTIEEIRIVTPEVLLDVLGKNFK
jgi:putative PIN family toxin of toxin-antitoxin system